MPDAGYFGLTYELLFEGDAGWTDITPLVDSRQTKVDIAGCSDSLKSVIGKCTIEMRYGTNPAKVTHSTIVGKLLTAKSELQTVRFRMGGIFTFVGKVDLGNFSQKNGRIPGFVTVTVEDNSYLLDEKMDTSFEYPANDDLDDTGWAVFDKNNLAQSIVMLRFLDAGYTIDQIDLTASDSITEKVRRVVYDADDERTYRDFIDTLLYEHCAVLYTTPEGKLSVRRLYKESPTSERSLDHFLVNDGIETSGGDYAYDGVKVVWSNLSRLDGAVVYNANITLELDDEGNRVGEEIQPHHYWPEDGDIEETWQEFDATFLDRPYQTKQSRLKNKDLSLISVKNAYYEVDKDPEILLANNPPEIEPTKARVLWWNSHETLVKKLYGFTIVGDALFRSKLNETTYPIDAKRLDEPYETEFVYTSDVATRLANHLHRFRKYGDLQHKWAEINVDTPMFQVVTVSAPDTLISSLAMVISQSITFPAPNKVKRANSAIGITAFNSEPVRTRSTQLGGAPVNTGPAGSSGTRSVVQFILGTADAPYSDAGTVVGTSLGRVGTSLALVGVEGAEWSYDAPTPGEGEYVWRREGYYTPPEVWPKVWEVVRLTGDKGEQGPQGLQGLQGPQGDQGIQGPAGADGATAYSHIAYADDAEGTGFSQDPTGKAYIGFYADHTEADSEDPADYAWSLIKGADGAQGIPGPAGADGLTAYFHTAWANSSDGTTDFSTTVSAGKMYIGTYSDNTQADSTNPSSYKWVKIKGETGESGAPARAINLYASSNVINISSRGELKTQQIEITCLPSNLPISDAVWTATDEGSLSQIEIAEGVFDQYRRILDCSLVTGDSTLISVSIVFEGVTYSGTIGIAKVADGTPSPLYLGAQSSVPTLTAEGPLVSGDFFLYIGPYSGPNSDPGDQGLNPPALEINEFVYGRIYEYIGKNADDEDQWKESRKSEHLAAAQKDALQIAKDSNTYMFVAVLVAQLGLFQDLLVEKELRSTNYASHKEGSGDTAKEVPDMGFKLNGKSGEILAYALRAYEADIFGSLTAGGFKTLQEQAGITIDTESITPSLWKHSEMEALIPDQDSLAIVSGVINGFVFARAVRRKHKRILQRSTGYEYEAISAGESHKFTWLTPDVGWGMQCYVEYSGYYKGNYAYRRYLKKDGSTGEEWVLADLPTSYSRAYIENINRAGQAFCCQHWSGALFDFGALPSYVNYHNIWTPQIFTGIVLTTEPVLKAGSPGNGDCYDFNYLEIPPEPTAYYPTTKTWTIGSYNQNSIANYCSGTDFYNLFSSLAIGADGFCDGGQINVNGTLYTVTRLTKGANSITFYTSGGVITVNKFQEGTNVGVYTELAVTQAINFQAVVGGIEVKHIFPWGTQAGSPGSYDIGTSDVRFNTAWLNLLDVLNAVRFRSTLQVDGAVSVASINTGGLGDFLIGQNLRPTDSPTFAGLTVGGWEHKRTTHKYQPPVNGNVYIDAMDIGERRSCTFGPLDTTSGDNIEAVYLPSGGKYFVQGVYSNANGEKTVTFQLFAGGSRIAWDENSAALDIYNGYFIIRRMQ